MAKLKVTFCATLPRPGHPGSQLTLVLNNGQIWTVDAISETEVELVRRKYVTKLHRWPVDTEGYKWLDWCGVLRTARTPKAYQAWKILAFMEWVQDRAWVLVDPLKIEHCQAHKMDIKKIPR